MPPSAAGPHFDCDEMALAHLLERSHRRRPLTSVGLNQPSVRAGRQRASEAKTVQMLADADRLSRASSRSQMPFHACKTLCPDRPIYPLNAVAQVRILSGLLGKDIRYSCTLLNRRRHLCSLSAAREPSSKGTTGIVLEALRPRTASPSPQHCSSPCSIGLSVPVIGAGIALDQGASAASTVCWGSSWSGSASPCRVWALLGRRPKSSRPTT